MLKIQVLGKGLIPRGHGIAPKKEPFSADLTLIGTILGTAGLKVNYINPETNQPSPLTRENYQNVYRKYPNGTVVRPAAKENQKVEQKENISKTVGIPKAGIELKADGVIREAVIEKSDTVIDTPVQVEAAASFTVVTEKTEKDAKIEEKKDVEFSMKPIMAPEEKKPQVQQNNNSNNRNQQNGQRR